jgi:hypothetical protein
MKDETVYTLIGIGILLILCFFTFLILRYRQTVHDIVDHTLKRVDPTDGRLKWSRTSLTMFTAWLVVLWAFHADWIKNGFNQHSFDAMLATAVTSKVFDAISRKLNGDKPNGV